jgi:nitroreductase
MINKEKIKNNRLVVSIRLFLEMVYDFRRLIDNLGAIDIEKDREKFYANILISIHSIEKGLSLPEPRAGFGKLKILNVLTLMRSYKEYYGYDNLFDLAKPIFEAYISFSGEKTDPEIVNSYNDLFKYFSSELSCLGGTMQVSKIDIFKYSKVDFATFCAKRFSVRDFSELLVDLDLIIEAVRIASKSPSACNRQPWHVYAFRDIIIKRELLEWQLGNKGFGNTINTALLITCNLKSYFINESHQAYVDGGLYAMTLMYALHSLGLGTIPLTVAMMSSKTKILYSKFGVKNNEVPVVLIGVGHLKDKFKVAISERFDYNEYLTII